MNGRSGVAVSAGWSAQPAGWSAPGSTAGPVEGAGECPVGVAAARGAVVPERVTRPRPSAGRVAPRPAGPGRVAPRSARRAAVRPMPARRPAASSAAQSRAVAGRMRPALRSDARRSAGWRGAVALVLAGLASAAAVFALGALADAMAQARLPEATGPVVVRADETLLQLAHRAAPSADPTAVVHRIAVLNDLKSPSVQPGQVIVSPIG